MEDYEEIRPDGVEYYFVRQDGQQLSRQEFVNMLDLCLLHTSYHNIRILSHSLRIGGASTAILDGQYITSVEYAGRWRKGSKAFEHYNKTAYITMDPAKVFMKLPRFRRQWSNFRLASLARNYVQTPSPPEGAHPHDMMIQKKYPQAFAATASTRPVQYPAPHVAHRLALRQKVRVSGKYIQKIKERQRGKLRFVVCRQYISALARRTRMHKSPIKATMKSLREMESLREICDVPGKSVSVETQTDPHVKATYDVAIQVDHADAVYAVGQNAGKAGDLTPQVPQRASELLKQDVHFKAGDVTPQVWHWVSEIPKQDVRETVNPETGNQNKILDEILDGQNAMTATWFSARKAMTKRYGRPAPSSWRNAGPGGEVSTLKHKVATIPYYKVKKGSIYELVTREEYQQLEPGKKIPTSASASDNRNVVHNIKYRISKRYRDYRANVVERSRIKKNQKGDLPELLKMRPTSTIKALVVHFHDRVIQFGSSVVPYIEEKDPDKTDDEFFEEVKFRGEQLMAEVKDVARSDSELLEKARRGRKTRKRKRSHCVKQQFVDSWDTDSDWVPEKKWISIISIIYVKNVCYIYKFLWTVSNVNCFTT